MATLAGTFVGDPAVAKVAYGTGLNVEVWQIASGGATGDTCAITPKRGRFVISASGGPFTNNLSTAGTSTNVTLTLVGGTATQGASFVTLLVQP